ncbi:uncharacterized protein [Rutidosis leptorrhynchoides]|uniref:uncharacterized protein n=1 Tax=Rutidosis leptorrhynchoides TaxID=125765 RepID=UPI003A99739D
MWESLDDLMRNVDSAWVLCGDLNEVREQTDRLNYVFHQRRATWFNEFVARNNLTEIVINGKKFTRICDNGIKFSKLDRFLVTYKFISLWQDLPVNALERRESDHCPIVL